VALILAYSKYSVKGKIVVAPQKLAGWLRRTNAKIPRPSPSPYSMRCRASLGARNDGGGGGPSGEGQAGDNLVDFAHDADGFRKGDDDFLVMVNVV